MRKSILVVATIISLSAEAQCIRGNCVNGYGVYVFRNDEEYAGEFKNGLANGAGTFSWPTGEKYVGEFLDDQKH